MVEVAARWPGRIDDRWRQEMEIAEHPRIGRTYVGLCAVRARLLDCREGGNAGPDHRSRWPLDRDHRPGHWGYWRGSRLRRNARFHLGRGQPQELRNVGWRRYLEANRQRIVPLQEISLASF